MNRPAAGYDTTLAVGGGTLTAQAITMNATTVSSSHRTDVLSVSSGSVTVASTFTSAGTTGCIITFTGAGTIDFQSTMTLTGNPSLTTFTGSTVK